MDDGGEIVGAGILIGQDWIGAALGNLLSERQCFPQGLQRCGEIAGRLLHLSDPDVVANQIPLKLQILSTTVRSDADHRFANGEGLAIAAQCSSGIAQVGPVRVTQHVPNPLVGGGQLLLQGYIALRLFA